MPLLGSDTILASLMKSKILAENSKHGLRPPEPKALDSLTNALASAIIAHLISNAQVSPGIVVATNAGSGTTVGPGVIT